MSKQFKKGRAISGMEGPVGAYSHEVGREPIGFPETESGSGHEPSQSAQHMKEQQTAPQNPMPPTPHAA